MSFDHQTARAFNALTGLESWAVYMKRQLSVGQLDRDSQDMGIGFMSEAMAAISPILNTDETPAYLDQLGLLALQVDRPIEPPVESPASPDPVSDEEEVDTDSEDDLPPFIFTIPDDRYRRSGHQE